MRRSYILFFPSLLTADLSSFSVINWLYICSLTFILKRDKRELKPHRWRASRPIYAPSKYENGDFWLYVVRPSMPLCIHFFYVVVNPTRRAVVFDKFQCCDNLSSECKTVNEKVTSSGLWDHYLHRTWGRRFFHTSLNFFVFCSILVILYVWLGCQKADQVTCIMVRLSPSLVRSMNRSEETSAECAEIINLHVNLTSMQQLIWTTISSSELGTCTLPLFLVLSEMFVAVYMLTLFQSENSRV